MAGGEDYLEVILVLLILALLNGAIAYIDVMLQDLVSMTLYADRYMFAANGNSMVGTLFDITLGFGVSMIVLKFLKRVFPAMSCGQRVTRTRNLRGWWCVL